jgi:hypothetical protein
LVSRGCFNPDPSLATIRPSDEYLTIDFSVCLSRLANQFLDFPSLLRRNDFKEPGRVMFHLKRIELENFAGLLTHESEM